MPRIDIAAELATCVTKIGGKLLDACQFPDGVRKADYWFPRHQVVAELKCLSEDVGRAQGFQQRVVEMHRSWVRRGLVKPVPDGRIRFNLRALPEPCAFQFLNYVKRRLERHVIGEASAQIRDTKQHLGFPDARGLLIVANDADSLCSPEMFAHVLARSTRGDSNTSINCAIFFSGNFPAIVRDTRERRLYWMDGHLGDRRPPVAIELREDLRAAWLSRYCEIFGPVPIYESKGDDAGKRSIERLYYPSRSRP